MAEEPQPERPVPPEQQPAPLHRGPYYLAVATLNKLNMTELGNIAGVFHISQDGPKVPFFTH